MLRRILSLREAIEQRPLVDDPCKILGTRLVTTTRESQNGGSGCLEPLELMSVPRVKLNGGERRERVVAGEMFESAVKLAEREPPRDGSRQGTDTARLLAAPSTNARQGALARGGAESISHGPRARGQRAGGD